MKKSPTLLGMLAIVLCCASPLEASTLPPPIDTAALQAYSHGSGTISGSTRFAGGVQAFCAPNIPYVAWYVQRRKLSPTYVDYRDYDSRVNQYTHRAQIRKDRTFTCEGLAPGPYLVWVEGYTPGFSGHITDSRPLEDPISGQLTPGYYTVDYGSRGSAPQMLLVGPEHVIVPAAGTANTAL